MKLRDCTRDRFLGGRIIADQPINGFRAGHDTVLLAAAVTVKNGDHVLELGSGVGVATLCLAARVSGIQAVGIELDPHLVEIANENAVLNGMARRVRFITADVRSFSPVEQFDRVFLNPPFHPDTGQVSAKEARDRAKRDTEGALMTWTRVALALATCAGTVTAILRADRVDELLAEASGQAVTMFPLYPHAGELAKRVIVRIAKGEKGSLRRGLGLILHEPGGRNTEAAEAVLRHGAALDLV